MFSAIVGTGVAHFHQHVFARHRGTPAELDWMSGNEWDGAPRGGQAEVTALADRLRSHFGGQRPIIRRAGKSLVGGHLLTE